jgi:hypothetical protein
MRYARMTAILMLMLSCICLQAHTQGQKTTVTGKLSRVMAIGGESTGWSIQLDSEITVDGKQLNSIEIDYADAKTLQALENKRVKAKGRLADRHGVETGDRPVLDISSIKEAKPK